LFRQVLAGFIVLAKPEPATHCTSLPRTYAAVRAVGISTQGMNDDEAERIDGSRH
jgi:hypothetical protein